MENRKRHVLPIVSSVRSLAYRHIVTSSPFPGSAAGCCTSPCMCPGTCRRARPTRCSPSTPVPTPPPITKAALVFGPHFDWPLCVLVGRLQARCGCTITRTGRRSAPSRCSRCVAVGPTRVCSLFCSNIPLCSRSRSRSHRSRPCFSSSAPDPLHLTPPSPCSLFWGPNHSVRVYQL